MKTTRLTPAEANFVANLLESNTSTQETKHDERVRQSLWAKCREIQYLARKRRP